MAVIKDLWNYVRSFRAIGLGFTIKDKAAVLLNRLRLLLYPLDSACVRRYGQPLIRPSERPIRCRSDGLIFYCANNRSVEMLLDPYEPDVKAALEKVAHGDFIDVGASIGVYSIRMAHLLGDKGRVAAVEPHPALQRLLERTIAENHLTNVSVVKAAAWSEPTTLTLYEHVLGGSPMDNSVVLRVSSSSLQVPAVTIDHIVETQRLDRLALVKIDAEGAEAEIMKGMGQTLSRFPRLTIVFEVSSEANLEACRRLLSQFNFRAYRMGESAAVSIYLARRADT